MAIFHFCVWYEVFIAIEDDEPINYLQNQPFLYQK